MYKGLGDMYNLINKSSLDEVNFINTRIKFSFWKFYPKHLPCDQLIFTQTMNNTFKSRYLS